MDFSKNSFNDITTGEKQRSAVILLSAEESSKYSHVFMVAKDNSHLLRHYLSHESLLQPVIKISGTTIDAI